MLLVYSHKASPRLKYILNLFCKDLWGIDYRITHSLEEYQQSSEPRLSYAASDPGGGLHISAHKLLFESGIREQNIAIGKWQGNITLFKNEHHPEIPFDVFAATFFLISRYEEYLPHIRDKYDRFEAESGMAWQHDFLQDPLVNYWSEALKRLLSNRFPQLTFKEFSYGYTSTIDIDNAYAFRQKGIMRTIGGYGRALVNFFWEDFRERTRVLLGKMQDPYDTYDMQLKIQKKYRLKVIYFFLLGDYGINDKNLPSNNRKFQSLIKHLNDYAPVGIHPSFGSNDNPDQVKKEIGRLSHIVHREIKNSRQHFLKLHFPETYKTLVNNGISDDYTMGYATRIGFRASICTPFYWYDLDTETETNLRIHPFAVMDATFRFYLKVKPEEVPAMVKPLVDKVKRVNGEFISIWHNETISNWREWKGWEKVYEDVVKLARVSNTS